jgi:NAD-dependent deacetylase
MGSCRFVALTGAGVSADSGLATFRDGGGLWESHRVEDVATPQAWRRDPALVWRFYQLRRARLLTAEPNAGHYALTTLEREILAAGGSFVLISQNVDDLHQRAGSRPLSMHGELLVLRCERCAATLFDREHMDPERFVPCPRCNGDRLRPDVVWFGEIPRHLDAIEAAVKDCTHFLAAGTSGAVYPAAGLLALARQAGAATFVNALEAPENLHPADVFLPGRSAQVLPRFVQDFVGGLFPED